MGIKNQIENAGTWKKSIRAIQIIVFFREKLDFFAYKRRLVDGICCICD
jgi:hypothetical protein